MVAGTGLSAMLRTVPLSLLLALSAPFAASAETVTLEDPLGDDHGPGSYVHPAVDGFRPGTFDLRKIRFARKGRGVTLSATFAATPQWVSVRSSRDDPGRRVFMPVIDIYTASSPKAGSGHRALLPGRRVGIAGRFGWDRAIVVSASPDLLEAHYSRVAPGLAADTCFPRGVKTVGRTLQVFIPGRCLPEDLDSAWFLVLVSGLGPGSGLGQFLREDDDRSPEAGDRYIREVGPNTGLCNVWEDGLGRSPCTFGGCKPCGWHPWVLDVMVPAGTEQETLLGDYSRKDRRLAALPFLDARGNGAARPPVEKTKNPGFLPPRHRVVSVRGRQFTIQADSALPAGTIGALICPGEKPGGTVVTRGEAAGFVVLEKVEDDTPLCDGAEVEF